MTRYALLPLALSMGFALAACDSAPHNMQYTQTRAIDTDIAAVHEERGPTALHPGESFTRNREPAGVYPWLDGETID